MKLSVLITFYNQVEFVDETLNSVFAQYMDYDMEVLVGDDGSNDSTVQNLGKWLQKYPGIIKIYQMPRDPAIKYNSAVRASKNRLNLLSKVQGEYFIFLDGDDYYIDPLKFHKQISVLEQKCNSDCIGCAHNMIVRSELCKTEKKLCSERLKEKKFSFAKYWMKYYFHPDSIMYRSSHISDILKMNLDDFFNDNLITYSFLQFGTLYYLADIMAVYRMTGTGIWTCGKKNIGLVRDITTFDLERKINPHNLGISIMRHRNELRKYFKMQGDLNDPELDDFYVLAEKANATVTVKLRHYSSLRIMDKVWLQALRFVAWLCAMMFYVTMLPQKLAGIIR